MQIASLSVGRDAIGVSVLGDWLVALGGYDGIQYLKIVEQYDAETNEWTPIAPVNYSRAGACVVAIPNSFSNPASTTGGVALPSTSAANPSSPNNAIAASSSSSAVNVPVANNSTTV